LCAQALKKNKPRFTYGIMYGVRRTTIYLSEEQKQALEAIALRTNRTESDLIREGLDRVIEIHRLRRRKPRPLFALDDPVLDNPNRVGEALEGFGED
jgi:ribbon-helix-helix CopG family protein